MFLTPTYTYNPKRRSCPVPPRPRKMTELPVSASYKLVLETTDILYDYSDTKILHTITAPLHAANTLAHSLLRDEIAGLGNYPTEPVEETVDKRTGGVTLTTSGYVVV